MSIIYALVDPRNGKIRYVGKTTDTYSRLKSHMNEATHYSGTHRLHWLRQLLNLNLAPMILVLEEIEGDNWQHREQYWITYGRSIGWPLTNATAGGEGLINPSVETRKKLSRAAKGKCYAAGKRTKEFCLRMAEHAKGNQNRLGKSFSEESKEKISASLKKHFRENPPPVGERVSSAKFTEKQILAIREEWDQGNSSLRKIAKKYGVCHETVRKIVLRKTWAHI